MTKQDIDNIISQNIYTNDAGLITGLVLQQVLLAMTDFTDEQITAIISQVHTHANKVALDQITQNNIDVLSKLSIVENKLRIDADAYSTGELSAYGEGESTGSGTSYNRLDSWLDYIVGTSEGWVLSALLGKELDDRVTILEDAPPTDSDKHFVYSQTTPASIWTVIHNLGKYPAVTVVDSANTEVVGDIQYIDLNSFRITFSSDFSGKAFCN